MKTVDYLIIGQGLAGTVLADHLLKLQQKVSLINESRPNASSMVAAGIVNPITGRKMVKTWLADRLFPYLMDYYSALEKDLGASFFHQKKVYKPFLSTEEYNEWMGKSADSEYQNYVHSIESNNEKHSLLKSKHGGILLNFSGYVDIPSLIKTFREKLRKLDAYQEAIYDESDLLITEEGIEYQDIRAKKIIFCNGMQASTCKYFSGLPFRLVKGELIEIKTDYDSDKIYNRGVFMLPKGDNLYRVGATYNNRDINNEISEEGRQILEEKLQELINIQYRLNNQFAGIRPASKDRRPLVGFHPQHPQLAIFNGLGAKGVSLAPYFAKQFANALVNNGGIDKEVNIERYYTIMSNP